MCSVLLRNPFSLGVFSYGGKQGYREWFRIGEIVRYFGLQDRFARGALLR